MPLVGYHLLGFDQEPISFRDTDHRLLQSPEHRERTEKFFSRSPHRFNLIFHNRMPYAKYDSLKDAEVEWLQYGRIGGANKFRLKKTREELLDLFLAGKTELIDPDAINFVFMQNATGEPILPLTPHMMAHRMGHIHLLVRDGSAIYKTLVYWGDQVLQHVYDYRIFRGQNRSKLNRYDWDVRLYSWSKDAHLDGLCWNALFKDITTTRAGRHRQVMGWEYIPEWLAQHIHLDGVRFPEHLPEQINLKDIYQTDRAYRHGTVPHMELIAKWPNYPLRAFADRIDELMYAQLRDWKGEVIVT